MELSLREAAERIASLLETYELEGASLREALDRRAHFRLAVPFVGPLNAGKSSLLNALLGMRLLPVGITAATAVPTQLSYGEKNAGRALRGGKSQPIGLGELRQTADLAGVTRFQAQCRLPFLAQIPNLTLLDTPGFGSRYFHEDSIFSGLVPGGSAWVLVFSADEPVVRESDVPILRAMGLLEGPVCAILNKCDKLTPEEETAARQYLEESLSVHLGRRPDAVLCLSARQDPAPLRELLLSLQSQAEQRAEDALRRAVAEVCPCLRDYLSLRMESLRLSPQERERQAERLSQWEDRLIRPFETQTQDLRRQAARWEEALSLELEQTARSALPFTSDMLLNRQNPAPYLDDALRTAVTGGLRGGLLPVVKGYLKSVQALLRLEDRFDPPVTGESPAAGWSDLSLPSALLDFPSSEEPFLEILAHLRGVPRRKRSAALEAVLDQIPAGMVQRPLGFAIEKGRALLEGAEAAARTAVDRSVQARRAALRAVPAQAIPQEQRRREEQEALRQAMELVEAAVSACEKSVCQEAL